MPVRFRCKYCNQLMGIARRKIGMEVNCPTCHNPVTVPPTDSPDVDQPAPKKDPLFEGSDLDALLRPAAAAPPDPVKPAAPGWPPPARCRPRSTWNRIRRPVPRRHRRRRPAWFCRRSRPRC